MSIERLDIIIQKTLPLVYDDSLSYLEFLAKVVAKVNEAVEELNIYLNQDLRSYVEQKLIAWETDGTLDAIIMSALGGGLTAHLADNPISPKRYGAVGDGVTDDTVAVQSALDGVISGKIVDLNGHVYAVSGVTINKKLTLINGKINLLNSATNSAIKIANGVAGVVIENVDVYINTALNVGTDLSGIWIDTANDCIIRNCRVDGSKNANYADPYMHSCIYGKDSDNLIIENCYIKNSEAEGIITENCDDVIIRGCTAEDCGASGMGTSTGLRAIIDGCTSKRAGASGITLNSQDGMVINCVVMDNVAHNGITIGHTTLGAYAENCQAINNRIINAAQHGISVNYSKNCLVENNNITLCTGSGIRVIPDPTIVTNTIIKGNNIMQSGLSGIDHSVSSSGSVGFSIIDGNIVNDSGEYGIKVINAGDNIITNNIVKTAPIGLTAHGAYTGNSRINTMNSCDIKNNQIIATQTKAILIYNLSRSSIESNRFNNINMTNQNEGDLVHVLGIIPLGTAYIPTPNPLIVQNNVANTISASAVFVNVKDSAFDATVRKLIYKNNEVSEIVVAMRLLYVTTRYTLTADFEPYAQIYRNVSVQSIPNNTVTTVQFNSTKKDNYEMADLANYGIKCTLAGFYLVSGQIAFNSNPTGERAVFIAVNGAMITGVGAVSVPGATVLQFMFPVNLAIGDVVTLQVRQQSGITLDIMFDAVGARSFMALKRYAN